MVTVCRVNRNYIYTGFDQGIRPFKSILGDPHSRSYQQAPLSILRCIRELNSLLNVLDRDQTLEDVILID
ncbi:hypothetical protein D3C80_1658410 [compost metagenome]